MNTYKMIQILFPKTKNISEVVDILHKHTRFGINTNQRMAHFLAQVREEVGEEFKPISENLNYKAQVLSRYEIDPITKKKIIVGMFKNFTPELAEKYGRNIEPANQEMIANIAYANRMGNGNAESGDGWRYRGAGVLQITGKHNYQEVQRRVDKYAPKSNINIVIHPKDIHTLEGAILAGLGFWIWKDLYALADMGISEINVDNITKKINLHTDSYLDRRQHFNKIKHLI